MDFEAELGEARKSNSLELGLGAITIRLSWQDDISENEPKEGTHQFHRECLRRIKYSKKCGGCGKEVNPTDIVMAKGEESPEHEPYVNSEFDKYKYKRKCELLGFVNKGEIPAEFVSKTITLYPAIKDSRKDAHKFDEAQMKGFLTLLEIVKEKTILTKIVLRNRERNALISSNSKYPNLLKCYILNYSDEVRDYKDLEKRVEEAKDIIKLNPIEKQQIEMMKKIDVEIDVENLKDNQTRLVEEFLKSRELKEVDKLEIGEGEVLTEMMKILKEKKKETK